MKNKGIRIIGFTLAAAFACTAAVSCKGKGGESTGSGGVSTLFVDMHTLMPTASETATPDQLYPVNASRYIVKKYGEITGVEVKWATDYAKPTDNITNVKVWYNNQINVKNVPAIGFTFGTGMQEDGVYVDLTEYLERPNPYVEGNERWKDLFQDWLWTDQQVLSADGKIVSVPVVLNPGTATAIYYNKKIFSENSLSIPKTWKEFLETGDKIRSKVDYPYVPYMGDTSIGLSSWAVRYSLAPGFARKMMDRTDYDGDGKTTTGELVRAVLEGKFNPNTCAEARSLYLEAYNYYKVVLPTGWESISDETYLSKWNEGKVAMKSQGLWYYLNENSNTLRKDFDFGLFAMPTLQSDSTVNAADLESRTLSEGFRSDALISLNIMKPAVENDPELLERAIDFLMYITTPTAVETMCSENGAGLPAVKGAAYPEIFSDSGWLENSFSDIGGSDWPIGFTSAYNALINASFNDWVIGKKSMQDFFGDIHRYQQQGARELVEKMDIDTTGWSI